MRHLKNLIVRGSSALANQLTNKQLVAVYGVTVYLSSREITQKIVRDHNSEQPVWVRCPAQHHILTQTPMTPERALKLF